MQGKEGGNKRLKLTLWKNNNEKQENNIPAAKWMSSKMRIMHKMKNSTTTGHNNNKVEDHHHHHQQKQGSYNSTTSFEGDHNLSSCSYNNNSNPPVRVCTDCNTTKTPLWRSGPKGPKVSSITHYYY